MGARKEPGTRMQDHRIALYLAPEEFADLSKLPSYRRCKIIREALRQAGLIGRASEQLENPPSAA